MKGLDSHFWYTKSQRNGTLLLILIILSLQLIFHFVTFSNKDLAHLYQDEIRLFQHQIDSLKAMTPLESKPTLYPFNPNYISDYKGYQLGMTTREIDRLLAYRKRNLFVNSSEEFQKVTEVSDRLLQKLAPYFKFPDWVQKKNSFQRERSINRRGLLNDRIGTRQSEVSSTDINQATHSDFLSINGVDAYLAERILGYRSKLQGFSLPEQLFEVADLDKEVASAILKRFSVQQKPVIEKININTASFKEVLSNPYIDYELCVAIFDYRDEVAELQSIEELKNITDFPVANYGRIVLYLYVN